MRVGAGGHTLGLLLPAGRPQNPGSTQASAGEKAGAGTYNLQGELSLHRAALALQCHAVPATVLPAGAGEAQPCEAFPQGHLRPLVAAAVHHIGPVLLPGSLNWEAALEGDLHRHWLPSLDHQWLSQFLGHISSDDGAI